MNIKSILVAAEILLLMIFLIPILSNILNPGNIAGILIAALLLAATLAHKRLFRFISNVWQHSVGKVLLILTAAVLIVSVIYALTLTVFIVTARSDKPDAPQAVIVLGCKVNGGKPSLMLKRRLNSAAEYLKNNPDVPCIVSGGKGSDEKISEAKAMKIYLVECGIDSSRILTEDKSVNTYENISNSLAMLDKQSGEIAIVTDGFHQYRAGYIAKTLGFDASAINAQTTINSIALAPTYYIRELMAISHEYIRN